MPGRDRPSGRAAGRPGRREIRLCPADAGDGCRAPPGGRFYIVRPFRVPRGTRFGRVARAGLPAGRRRWRDRAGGAGASAPDLRARGCTCRTSRGVWPPARVDQHARAAAVTDGRTDGPTDRPTEGTNGRIGRGGTPEAGGSRPFRSCRPRRAASGGRTRLHGRRPRSLLASVRCSAAPRRNFSKSGGDPGDGGEGGREGGRGRAPRPRPRPRQGVVARGLPCTDAWPPGSRSPPELSGSRSGGGRALARSARGGPRRVAGPASGHPWLPGVELGLSPPFSSPGVPSTEPRSAAEPSSRGGPAVAGAFARLWASSVPRDPACARVRGPLVRTGLFRRWGRGVDQMARATFWGGPPPPVL